MEPLEPPQTGAPTSTSRPSLTRSALVAHVDDERREVTVIVPATFVGMGDREINALLDEMLRTRGDWEQQGYRVHFCPAGTEV